MSTQLHITVAAVIEREGRFLLVEEHVDGDVRINQPAGHLEPGENLQQAVIREALEETGRRFRPTAVLGLYVWRSPNGQTYLRTAFSGSAGDADPDYRLDTGIVRTLWLSRDELLDRQPQWRSPLVLRCVDDYLEGRRYPLECLVDMLSDA